MTVPAFVSIEKPIQPDSVLTHVGVYQNLDLGALGAETCQRRERHEQAITNAVAVDHDAMGVLCDQLAAQVGNHRRTSRLRLRAKPRNSCAVGLVSMWA